MKNCTNLLVLCYFLSGVTGNMLIIDHQLLKVRIMTVITLFLAVVIILIIIYQQNLKTKSVPSAGSPQICRIISSSKRRMKSASNRIKNISEAFRISRPASRKTRNLNRHHRSASRNNRTRVWHRLTRNCRNRLKPTGKTEGNPAQDTAHSGTDH